MRHERLAGTWDFVTSGSPLVFLGRLHPAGQENYGVNSKVS